jgi:hypothetical protein
MTATTSIRDAEFEPPSTTTMDRIGLACPLIPYF